MYHYGGMTPKKHYAYANSSTIASLWVQRLTGWTKIPKEEREKRKTTTVYKDGKGKTRYKGNANLRRSEWYPQLLSSLHMVTNIKPWFCQVWNFKHIFPKILISYRGNCNSSF